MNLTKRKEKLERELASINRQIETCNHEYGEIQYDPEIVKVPYGSKIVKKGSDIWCEPEGYRDEKKIAGVKLVKNVATKDIQQK